MEGLVTRMKNYIIKHFSIVENFQCENENELAQYYYKPLGTCYEHFTVGPCEDAGKVFLPGGKCGCHVKLPNYHEDTDQCYELGMK